MDVCGKRYPASSGFSRPEATLRSVASGLDINLILELFEELFATCFQILTAIWIYLLGSQSANRKYLKFSPKEIEVT